MSACERPLHSYIQAEMMWGMTRRWLGLLKTLAISALVISCRHKSSPPIIESSSSFVADRAAHPTRLLRHGPSPQSFEPWVEGPSLHITDYESSGRALRGLYAPPTNQALARNGRAPVLVYLHGGFALGEGEVTDDCRPFLDAGFAVWAPAFRGENGNPGDHELYFGELDDARAAIESVGKFSTADPLRVVVFGHSAGAILSSLLTLLPSSSVVDSGGAGGLYGPSLFGALPVPFEDTAEERRLRLFAPNVKQMRHPHFACSGERDQGTRAVLEQTGRVAAAANLPLETRIVPGDHFESLQPCMVAFLERVLPKIR